MKILFVCSGNSNLEKEYSLINQKPFVEEQRKSLIKKGINVDLFLIQGKGFYGYLKNLPVLSKQIAFGKYDLVHAHFGISGMLAILQRKLPVVITFQGCDINRSDLRIISKIAMRNAEHNIFVSNQLAGIAKAKKKYSIIPYGIDLENLFTPADKAKCRRALDIDYENKLVLFSSSFNRPEKNYTLAKKSVEIVGGITLLELSQGFSRSQINYLLNACDLLLMTSLREGSPQIIKEAMACNCPIVTTPVGDVKEIIGDTKGCYITSFEPELIAEKIREALDFGAKTNGREKVEKFDLNNVADDIVNIYNYVLGYS